MTTSICVLEGLISTTVFILARTNRSSEVEKPVFISNFTFPGGGDC